MKNPAQQTFDQLKLMIQLGVLSKEQALLNAEEAFYIHDEGTGRFGVQVPDGTSKIMFSESREGCLALLREYLEHNL